ncbi:MAG: signal transduction histidine kinase/CheY-like chemotaxis protein [Sulfurimonas sp.]|jgi:signal transduction histidine kinase/CheY-like chemotaxis protein|uniref:ATP-binding protein n=1 Tax=Sulfurimonas sp. TaxID=2022749 RepID=UPI0039E2D02B
MINTVPNLVRYQDIFKDSKDYILATWVSHPSPKEILKLHKIDAEHFISEYGSGVFDYFMGVILGTRKIGDCPVMHMLLIYLKDRETSADEVFEICSHFRRTMIDFTYDEEIDSKEMADEISFMFDTNFRGVLTFYTNSIFQKLVDARQEAITAGHAKDYFLSNMSHEIRTPLNAILGFVNLMLSEDITNKQATYLDIIQKSGENLLSIINDILDFSKLRSGEFTVEPKIFSIHEEMTYTMELFVASATSKNITITSFIDPEIPKELFGDALRIKQILSNFLSNAIKFTRSDGVISVEASCHARVLKIKVEDNGIGINPKDMPNIFTAFSQAQFTETRSHAGTGLGLSICQQLAELMYGKVYAESVLGKGSVFSMEIPIDIYTNQCKIFDDLSELQAFKIALYTKDKEMPYQYESLLKYTDVFGMNTTIVDEITNEYDAYVFVHENTNFDTRQLILKSNKKYIALMSKDYDTYDKHSHIESMCFPLYCSKIHDKINKLFNESCDVSFKKKLTKQFVGHILIAEDNEANQEYMKIILTKYGLTYDLAQNGLEAIAMYKEHSYDLILMDEQMPIMDGNEAVGKIIKFENKNGLRHTPISALTANVIKGAKERGLLNGFDAFLGKPIVIKELERVFSTYLKMYSEIEDVLLDDIENYQRVIGLDMNKAREELLLTNEEIVMLVSLYIIKMKKIIPELRIAIEKTDYQQIHFIAHSIKGSSANFRLENLQAMSDELEKMAKKEDEKYDYLNTYENIKVAVEAIKIV